MLPHLRYLTVPRDVSTYVITGLQPATKYRFAVRIIAIPNSVATNPIESWEETTSDGRE